MEYFYYFTISATLASMLIRGRLFLTLLLIGCIITLNWLPTTGIDYEFYKQAYDNSYFAPEYPWFKTVSILTAEPFYKWYSSFIAVTTKLEFQGFLALNFCICFLLSTFTFRKLNTFQLDLFWLALLPVVFPTIFYFSPRSSLPFLLLLLGFVYICKDQTLLALALFFTAISLHSQYILAVTVIIGSYTIFRLTHILTENQRRIAGVALIFIIFGCLLIVRYLTAQLAIVLGVLPSAGIAVSKLRYLSNEETTGYRVTALLSVLIYPGIYLLLVKEKRNRKFLFLSDQKHDDCFVYLLGITIFFAALINIAFFGDTHLAGRLSRFSDYMCIGLLLPTFLMIRFNREVAIFTLLAFALVAPLIYRSVYGL